MDTEKSLVDKFIETSTPPRGELAPHEITEQAKRLADIFDSNRKDLGTQDLGGVKQLVTPTVNFSYRGVSSIEAGFFQSKNIAEGGPSISCFIKEPGGRKREEKTYAFYIDPTTGNITNTEYTAESFTDAGLLRAAVDSIDEVLESRQEARARSRRRVRKIGVWAAALAAATYGSYDGVEAWHNSDIKAAHLAAAKRVAFDHTAYRLPGKLTPVSIVDVGSLNPDRFKSIPKYHKGDNLLNARRFQLTKKTCRVFPVQISPAEQIVLDTSKTDNIHNQPLVAGVNTKQDLTVCSIQDYPDKHLSWSLAIQIEK